MSEQHGGAVGRNSEIETYQDDVAHLSKRKFEEGRKKYGDSWTDAEPEYLIRRMEEEFYEFRQAVEHDRDEDGALEEVADMVNFGLMFLAQHREIHTETGDSMDESVSGDVRKWPHRYDTDTGHGRIDSGGLSADLPDEGEYDAAVIGPSRGMVSLSACFEDGNLKSYVAARLSPEQAREMADSLEHAADQTEDETA